MYCTVCNDQYNIFLFLQFFFIQYLSPNFCVDDWNKALNWSERLWHFSKKHRRREKPRTISQKHAVGPVAIVLRSVDAPLNLVVIDLGLLIRRLLGLKYQRADASALNIISPAHNVPDADNGVRLDISNLSNIKVDALNLKF